MNSFWNWLLGDQASRDGTPELQWANMPESWGVFVLIAIVIGILTLVCWLYAREIDTCPTPVKMTLATLRFSVILLLILMCLKPSIVFIQTHTIKPKIYLMRDSSLSFARQDIYQDDARAKQIADATGWPTDQIQSGQYSRAEVLEKALEKDDNKWLKELRRKGSITVVDFSEITSDAKFISAINTDKKPDSEEDENSGTTITDSDDQLPALIANGRGTDIWQGLREKLAETGQTSAIILASDGQHNGSEDPLELARKANDLGIPIYTIGVGDPARPKNLAITDLYVRGKAHPDEPFEIESLLYAEDVDITQVDVQLVEHSVDDAGNLQVEKTLDRKTLSVPPQGGRIRADFQHTVTQPGKYVYTIRVDEVEGESELADNQRTSSIVEVVDEKVKVLLIAGAPTWEYRMLQRLLQRDQAISLSCWLQTMDQDRPQEGNEPIHELPQTIEELGQYNVIMMIDPDHEEFTQEWIDNLKLFCKRKAGGFFYMAGPKFTNMFVTLHRLDGIRDILPVRFGDQEFIETSETLASTSNSRPGQMLVVKHNLDHPVMSFHADPQENEARWAQMPHIYWSFPTLSSKPTARVLMERGDQINIDGNQPLLVAGRYGAGNVLYMGFNGTWRWRRVGLRAQYFDRFWVQVVRFLVETRSLQGSRRGIIDPDRSEYEIGDEIRLTSRVLNEQFEPMTVPEIDAVEQSEDGRTRNFTLRLLPGQEGQYEAGFVAQKTGTFTILVNLPGADEESGIEPVTYRVKPPSIESRTYWLNEKMLRDIADASGGKYYSINEISEIPIDVPVMDSKSEYSSPPEPLWDVNKRLRYIAFFLPFLLLTVEWAVRKRYKLM